MRDAVTQVQLSGKSIIGGIDNSSLFHLQYLKSLDLSFNNFSTPIPSSFGALTNLNYLNLSNACFVGQIPIELSRLTNLVTLDISTVFLQYPFLKLENPNLSMLVRNLTKLEELLLDGVNMSAGGNKWCQALSSSLPNLRVLSLTGCSLTGPIDDTLQRLQFLSVIHLDYNDLFAVVPGFIANFTNLTSLNLVSCKLYGEFPKVILQVPTLQIIYIADNRMLQGSLPEFSKNNSINELVISYTSFSGRLPKSIGNLSKLSKLDLSNCHFVGTVPDFMLSQLIYLDLSVNNFTGAIPSFNMSKNLANIDLSHNRLTGSIPLDHWEGLLKLEVVEIQDNSLSGSIPNSLFSLPSVYRINLSKNKLSGLLPEISNPSSSTLAVLDLSENNLEEPVPVSIFKLGMLAELSLSFNKLNGIIQAHMIQSLSSLCVLDLSYNNLSFNSNETMWSSFLKNISRLHLASCGLQVFPNLKNQSKLMYLDLSQNKIHGEIPNWIWGVGNLIHLNLSHNYLVKIQEPYALPSTLSVLDLQDNQISGKIPSLPPYSLHLDFSTNNFSSSIPSDFGDALSLTIFFSASSNRLNGVIPKSICNATNLYVLDLSDNYFTGKLPPCMSEMGLRLSVLSLRSNNFSGPIPNGFPSGCSLKTLDLSGNLMEGKIPKSLAQCAELEILDLGSNRLVDKFPYFLKSISTLRVLVLHSNKLYGSMECSSSNESWELLQIVDLAHNNFSGELPGQSLARWKVLTMADSADLKLKPLQVVILLKFTIGIQ